MTNVKMYSLFCFFLLLSTAAGCSENISLSLDKEESYVLVDNDRGFLTIYALVRNNSSHPAEDLYAEFAVTDEKVSDILGFEKMLFNQNGYGLPERFNVQPDSGYFISESFLIDENLSPDRVEKSIILHVANDDNKILKAPLPNIIKK